jgi:hypothetical protein
MPNRHVGRCATHYLFRWLTRKDARAGAQDLFPGQHLTPYRCGGYWHIGTLPADVVRGNTTRDGQPTRQVIPNPTGAAQIRAMWETTTRPTTRTA